MIVKKIVLLVGAFVALSLWLTSLSDRLVAEETNFGSIGVGTPNTQDNDPGRYSITIKNVSGGTIDNGDVVIWTHTDSSTGTAVSTSSVLASNQVAGVAMEKILNNSFGRIQTYGFHSAIKVRSASISTGTLLGVGTTGGFATNVTSTQTALGFSFQFVGSTNTQTLKGFIKSMGR